MTQYKKFKIGASYVVRGHLIDNDPNGLFVIMPTKRRINAKDAKAKGPFNYVSRGTTNNGIASKIQYDSKYLNDGHTLSFAQDTAAIFYQDEPYFTGNKVNVFKLNDKYGNLTRDLALYLVGAIRSAFPDFKWGMMLNIEKIANTDIELPVTPAGEPDFEYMTMRIRELEAERIRELEAYLRVTGLDDTTLSASEAQALKQDVRWKKFRIGDVFERVSLPRKIKHFKKSRDVSTVQSLDYNLPLVNSKVGNNGVMYYGKSSEWNSTNLAIDIIQDGAVGAGMVYAHPDSVGCLYNAYLIRWKDDSDNITPEVVLYFATMIRKAVRGNYNYQRKATWDRVQENDFLLPVTSDGQIDFNYMQNYIRAMEKQTIEGVVEYKDKVIEETKKVVNG